MEQATGRRERDTPGAGAAGGVGFGLLAIQDRFRPFALRPGVDLVMDATDFAGKLARADFIVTGEGRVDEQTAFGKTALGVARRAAGAGVPCIAVGGGVTPGGIEALAPLGVVVVPVAEAPQTVEAAMAAGTEPVERCGERIAGGLDTGVEMTAQASDVVLWSGEQWSLVGGEPLFDPKAHGLEPFMLHTGNWRGYHCRYAVQDGRLVLDHLEIGLDGRQLEEARAGRGLSLAAKFPSASRIGQTGSPSPTRASGCPSPIPGSC